MSKSFEAIVRLGELPIRITCDDPHELIRDWSYLNDLNVATEGRSCNPFYRKTRDGHEYFGFRDDRSAEVVFGRVGDQSDPRPYYAKRPGYVNTKDPRRSYQGFSAPQLEAPSEYDDPEIEGQAKHEPDSHVQEHDWKANFDHYKDAMDEARHAGDLERLGMAIAKATSVLPQFPETWRKNLEKQIEMKAKYLHGQRQPA